MNVDCLYGSFYYLAQRNIQDIHENYINSLPNKIFAILSYIHGFSEEILTQNK